MNRLSAIYYFALAAKRRSSLGPLCMYKDAVWRVSGVKSAANASDFDLPRDTAGVVAGSAVLQVVQAGWRHRTKVILRPTAERVEPRFKT